MKCVVVRVDTFLWPGLSVGEKVAAPADELAAKASLDHGLDD